MTVVAQDTFTAANGTDVTSRAMDTGHAWTSAPGSSGAVTIQANKAVDASFNGPLLYASAVPTSADYSVFLTVQTDAAGNYVGGPAGRVDTSTGECYAVYWNGGAQEWRLSTTSDIAAYAGDTPTTARTVELRMTGSTIAVYIDGVARISVTDTTYTAAGRPGAYFVGGSAARTHDDWTFDDPGVGAPIEQEGFRFGVDDGSESTHSFLADQDVSVTQPADQPILLSFLLDISGSAGAKTFRLQHRKVGDTTWIDTPIQ